MTVLAAWGAVLGRLAGLDVVVIGTATANRGRAEVEPLIGYFANSLALRVDLSGAPTVAGLLTRVRAVAVEAQQHQDLPFAKVLEAVQRGESEAQSSLFQAVLGYGSGAPSRLELPGVRVSDLQLRPGVTPPLPAKFDMALGIQDADGRLTGRILYAAALFERATVARYARAVRMLLEAMPADDGARIDSLPIVPTTPRRAEP
jgi:non-ribosomal peptide synthetase component F